MDNSIFATRLKELRKDKKINQCEFAKNFNVATGTIAMWETGKRKPDHETLNKLANFFDVSIDYLLGRENKKPMPQDMSFEQFKNVLNQKNIDNSKALEIAEKISQLSNEQINLLGEIIKQFK